LELLTEFLPFEDLADFKADDDEVDNLRDAEEMQRIPETVKRLLIAAQFIRERRVRCSIYFN
jgi:hypothetical protein